MVLTQAERDNVTRWDGERRGFYEVYYLKVNHVPSDTALWARYTLLAPQEGMGEPVAELWAIFFDRNDPTRNLALKRTYPLARAAIARDHFEFRVGEAVITHRSAVGGLAGEAGTLTWDLAWEPCTETFYHFPRPSMYGEGFPKAKALSPNLAVRMRGSYTVNGVTYRLADAPGHQSHLWGVKQGLRWTWANCNAFVEDPTAVFEGLSAQIKLGPVPSPALTIYGFRYQGQWYVYNSIRNWLTNRSRSQVGAWEIEARGQEKRFVGHIRSRLENLVGVEYTDTDGSKLWCHNAKVGDMTLEVYQREGRRWAHVDTLTSQGTTAVEWVMREKYAGVEIRV